jgi:hypothetical protein
VRRRFLHVVPDETYPLEANQYLNVCVFTILLQRPLS